MEEKNASIKQFLSFIIPLLMAMSVIVYFSIVITGRYKEWRLVLSKKEALEREVAQLKEKNLQLLHLRDNLLYDPVQIEKEVREQMGYSLPEEIIFKTSNPTESTQQVPSIPQKEMTPHVRGDGSEYVLGKFEKLKLFFFFVGIIVITIGFFSLSYWYEKRRNYS